jgi:oligosaccharide repeat unit polymerase
MQHSLNRHKSVDHEFLILSLFFFLAAATSALVIFMAESAFTHFTVQLVIAAYCLTMGGLAIKRWVHFSQDKAMALSALVGAQVFWFAAPALLVILGLREWFAERFNYHVNNQNLVLTTVYLTLFAFLSLGSYHLMKRRLMKRIESKKVTYQLSKGEILAIVLLLVAAGILPFFVYSDSLAEVVNGITASRTGIDKGWHQAAFESRPFQVMGRASLVAAACLALFQALRSTRIVHRLAWSCVFAFGFLITYLDSGTRTWTALILVPPLLITISQRASGRTVRLWMLGGLVLLTGIILIGQFQLAIRNGGFSAETLRNADTLALYDNDFFTETAVAVDLVPAKINYLFESNTILFLVNPIPRSLWAGKPYPRVIEQYTLGRSGVDEYRDYGISRMPSIVGQHYMAWGVPGIVLIASLIGMFLAWLDYLWKRQTSTPLLKLWTASTTVWVFLGFRGLFPGFHWAVLILGAIVLFERRKSGKTRIQGAFTRRSLPGTLRFELNFLRSRSNPLRLRQLLSPPSVRFQHQIVSRKLR